MTLWDQCRQFASFRPLPFSTENSWVHWSDATPEFVACAHHQTVSEWEREAFLI